MIYMAPELINHQSYSLVSVYFSLNDVVKPVDIWSCGIIMYVILSMGKHPLY